MCNEPKYFGFDFNGDGTVSFEESYLTYRISEDVINSNNDDSEDNDDFSSGYDGSDDFGGDDY